MDFFQIILLALIQGITEFLPISSSAHLILPAQLFGFQDQGLAFDVAVHVGSLIAVVSYFRHDVLQLSCAWLASLKGKHSQQSTLAWSVFYATIPAVIAGLLINDYEHYLRSTLVIAATTIGFGIVLAIADKMHNHTNLNALSHKQALIIGLAQALALIPGTSRSGITMTAALFLGFHREAAARFSFLLSIPLIIAAGCLKSWELAQSPAPVDWIAISLGTLLSGISAYLCIKLFLKFIERMGFMPFVIYRLILGSLLIWLYFQV